MGVGRTIAIALADSGREEHLSTSIAVSGSQNSTDVDFSIWTMTIDDEELVNDNQQYLKKGAQIYVEGQLTTRKWKDEQSGQDKYSTEIVIQGYNSSLTMLGGANSSSGIQNDTTQQNNIEDSSQVSNDMDDEIPF